MSKMSVRLVLSFLIITFLRGGYALGESERSMGPSTAAPETWLNISANHWKNLLPKAKTDNRIPIPQNSLSEEKIGQKKRIKNTFDRWTLRKELRDRTFFNYADVTEECKGEIELEFAFTKKEWAKTEVQNRYYASIESLIEKIANQLLEDQQAPFGKEERELFVRALKAVTWNESLWQHYYRHKDWFFVLLSDAPFNHMSNWGISQIARSDYLTGKRLNQNFFESKAYCKISSTLYYGFLIFYTYYMDARSRECNGVSTINRLMGAYNSYCSGYAACFFDISNVNPDLRKFQIRALGGFMESFVNRRWKVRKEPYETD